jgi:hypothetical protein
VQAARFDRGDLIEVVLAERRPDESTERAGRDPDDDVLSPMDRAIMTLTKPRARRDQSES